MLRKVAERSHNRVSDGRRFRPLLRHWAALLGIGIGAAWLTASDAKTVIEDFAVLSFSLRVVEEGTTHHAPTVLWKQGVPVEKYSHSEDELVEATVWVPEEVGDALGSPDPLKVITLTVVYYGSHKKGHCSWEGGDWVCGTQ